MSEIKKKEGGKERRKRKKFDQAQKVSTFPTVLPSPITKLPSRLSDTEHNGTAYTITGRVKADKIRIPKKSTF